MSKTAKMEWLSGFVKNARCNGSLYSLYVLAVSSTEYRPARPLHSNTHVTLLRSQPDMKPQHLIGSDSISRDLLGLNTLHKTGHIIKWSSRQSTARAIPLSSHTHTHINSAAVCKFLF